MLFLNNFMLPLFLPAVLGGLETARDRLGYSPDNTVEGIVSGLGAVALSLLGVLFMGLTIYAGVIWMTAEGNPAKIKLAQGILRVAIIGLIIVISSYVISTWLGTTVQNVTG
jgi:hypothetical protein